MTSLMDRQKKAYRKTQAVRDTDRHAGKQPVRDKDRETCRQANQQLADSSWSYKSMHGGYIFMYSIFIAI